MLRVTYRYQCDLCPETAVETVQHHSLLERLNSLTIPSGWTWTEGRVGAKLFCPKHVADARDRDERDRREAELEARIETLEAEITAMKAIQALGSGPGPAPGGGPSFTAANFAWQSQPLPGTIVKRPRQRP